VSKLMRGSAIWIQSYMATWWSHDSEPLHFQATCKQTEMSTRNKINLCPGTDPGRSGYSLGTAIENPEVCMFLDPSLYVNAHPMREI